MRTRPAGIVLVVLALAAGGCSRSGGGEEGGAAKKNVEYGDTVGIEFGGPPDGPFLAAVAAEKGHSAEKGVPALAGALQQAARSCPTLASEATDQASPPTLHLVTKAGSLEAAAGARSAAEPASATCMTKALAGKASGLDSSSTFELTIQLLVKPQKK
ncbi:MAG: hypothetical protein JWP97_2702 [Labilithrix sp.]|nr:hypothetical protein [Labilithrix sp.]